MNITFAVVAETHKRTMARTVSRFCCCELLWETASDPGSVIQPICCEFARVGGVDTLELAVSLRH